MELFRRPAHVVSMIVLVLSSAHHLHAGQRQQIPAARNQQPATPPINITVTTPEKNAAEKEAESKRAALQESFNHRSVVANERIAFWTVFLFAVGSIQAALTAGALIFARHNLKQLSIQVADSIKATKAATTAANAAKADAKANMLAQRAYVSIAHTPAGIHKGTDGRYTVRLQIKNVGNTPATVHHTKLRLIPDLDTTPIGNLPDDAVMPGGYLTPRKSFEAPLYISLAPEQEAAYAAGKMWLAGYADYTDEFNQRRRRGYCRHAEPAVTIGNNLSWDKTSAKYNYDRKIKKNDS